MLDGLGGCRGNQQGLFYVPEVIRTELISKHHDEGTSASIQLKNLLPGNLRETCSCRYRLDNESRLGRNYLYLPIDQSQLGRNFLYLPIERTQVTTWAGWLISAGWKDTSYDSIFIVVDRLTKMVHSEPVQIPIDAPRLLRLDCQRLRLSLHFQVLIFLVSLPSSTAVTIYASSMRTSIRIS